MKTKESIYSALFIGCLLAAAPSCSNEDDKLPKEKTPVGITATLTGEVETKADTDVNYTPTANTKIYMYYNNGANTTATEKAVYTYSSSGTWNTANQTTNASDCIFWDDLGKVGGNYPFFAISPTDVGATSTAVQENQNTGTNLVTSDLLMAYTANTKFKDKVNLVFKHMLSKLTIKVDVSKVANASSVGVAAVINKAVKNYTVNYVTPTIDLPAAVTKGSATATITPMTVTATGTTRVFSAVLPAQDIQSGLATITVTVTQKGSGTATDYTYTYQPAAASKVALEQGKETTLTLTIKGTVVELGTIKVTDWTSKTASGDITIDNP